MIVKNKHNIIPVFASLLFAVALVPMLTQESSAYSPNCVSAACRAAEDQEAAARARASEASQKANDVAGMVASLDAELAAQEAEINAQQSRANDLKSQIEDKTAELERDQAGLAKILVNMHFTKAPSAISLLASTESIGELSSAEARQTTVRDQISSAIKKVSSTKQEIEQEKSDVDSLLADLNTKKSNLASNRAERSATVARYQSDASAAKSEAAAANKKAAQEIAAEIARHNTGGQTGGGGGNTYPWRGQCPGNNMGFQTPWGLVCQCTSYAGYKANEYWHNLPSAYWGNANNWGNAARARGYRVDSQPAPHTIAVSTAGAYGHVMWVESVNGNGTINLSEYNNYGSSASHLPGDYGTRVNVPAGLYQYIHFGN